jgi:hypothetical protein
MFMLSWRGYGLVGIGLPLVCLGLSSIVLGDISHPAMARLFWGLLLASSPVLWWLGNQLNGGADPGDEPHRFMGLSLQKVPLLYLGLFALYLVGKAMQ